MIKRLIFIAIALILVGGQSINAVTKEEMEQARATAALWYLRYVNDGSGYLESLSPKTISELELGLKGKEKENIGVFKKVAVPSDYAKWTKEQLVEYWSKTIFSGNGFPEKAQAAKSRIRSKLNAMTISTSEPETTTPQPPTADSVSTTAENSNLETPAVVDSAIDENTEEVVVAKKDDSSSTMVYVVILIILVVVVVALVVYALNSTKKNTATNSDNDELRNIYEEEMRKKDEKIEALTNQLQSMSIRLRNAEAKLSMQEKQTTRQYTARPISVQNPRTIFLAQANAQGVFVRADAAYNMGNSIFKLVTTDGVSGTFSVIEDESVYELALMMPSDFLINACAGNNLQLAAGMHGIVTENPGTAIFENGKWRVIRKAEIRYTR